MSINTKWVTDPGNQAAVVAMYRSKEFLTLQVIADRLNTRLQNVQHVVRAVIPEAERRALASIRYSLSKEGSKNPMHGKFAEQHHNWIGLCEDGRGYLTILWNDKREFAHRVVMMEALGVRELPATMDVHHIDGDPKNNALDNLALVTVAGHRRIHFLQVKESKSVSCAKFRIAEALKYTI